MSPQEYPPDDIMQELSSRWGPRVEFAICEKCQWRYLLSGFTLPQRCPNCYRQDLSAFHPSAGDGLDSYVPERVQIHKVKPEGLHPAFEAFVQGIPFAPVDLTIANVVKRLQRVYLPVWLVDAEVQARWNAEAGYNYQVVSHQDRYDERQGGWTSQKVKENRIRWEERLGQLARTYQNVSAPATDRVIDPRSRLGDFPVKDDVDYQPDYIQNTFIRLPDRSREDAWMDAAAYLQILAAADCQQAVEADHIRQFQWQPQFSQENWSLLLQPVYTSYYLDDDRIPRSIYVNGMSGRISGTRMASMKRAQRTAGIVLALAAIFFLIGLVLAALGFVLAPVLAFGGLLILLSIGIGLGALIPIVVAWQFNRANSR